VIQSATKQHLSPETIHALAAEVHAAPLSDSRELGNGYYNTALRLSYADGLVVVLKIAPHPSTKVLRQEDALLQTEVETLRYVSSHSDIPVPQVLSHCTSSPHVESPYLVLEHLAGVSLDSLMEEMDPHQLEQAYGIVGKYARELHELQMPFFARPTHRGDTWCQAFSDMINDVLLDAEDVCADLGVPSGEIRDTVAACAPSLCAVSTASLLHRDLWPGNVFYDVSSSRITRIIDWERAVFGDPLMEFVCALLEGLYVLGPRRAFYRSYGRTDTFTLDERVRLDLYTVYLALLLNVEGYFRDYRDPRQESQLRATVASLITRLQNDRT